MATERHSASRAAKPVWLVLAIILTVVLCSCTTVKSKPFTDYRDAFTQLQTNSAELLAKDYEWTYNHYVNKIIEKQKDITSIQLQFKDDAIYAWELPGNEPLFMKIKRSMDEHSALGDTFAQYTSLLAQLAGDEILPQATFDTMAADLKANSIATAKALKIDVSDDKTALFSALAVTAAKKYIENRRAKDLAEAIKNNQAYIDQVMQSFSKMVALTAEDLKDEYNHLADDIMTRWNTATDQDKPKLYKELLALNNETSTCLESLKRIDAAYLLFAKKHGQLGDALAFGSLNAFIVGDLVTEAKNIKALYDSIKSKAAQ